ncbi:hypothetical protein [Tolumonas osonensis]|uniref:Integral membrane protein n=1 Tax=Tolumonas osonensis TaxID=675874 RepID=A0A841G8Z8_9GAMM|nr:hypothetical protein [Tolumonas osonensis]MBB6055488.1 hypothetical protein [Tolumonas osonensis]
MVELNSNKLIFRFPEIHPNAMCEIEFQRTLRIPDDNHSYPLPPGLGRFPLEHVEDYASKLPSQWQEHGGVLLPMYQSEALWINFSSRHIPGNEPYPFAVKIATGKINAVTGEAWKNDLTKVPQDYVVIPNQPWLDGYCIQKGLIRQFVAMPQGQGFTAEEQITGTIEHGGLQIIVYPMKRKHYEELQNRLQLKICYSNKSLYGIDEICADKCMELGLAPGGVMKQKIYEDPHHFDVWDTSVSARCFAHILNSQQWQNVTGKPIPSPPPSAKQYAQAGLPWFEYYNDNLNALNGSSTLASLDSIAAKTIKKGEKPLEDNSSVTPAQIQMLSPNNNTVHDGKW